MVVCEIQINNWDQFQGELKQFSEGDWIFRGQGSNAWHLETSLERVAKTLNVPLSELPYREGGLIRRFKRQYHHYSALYPGDYIEWLSIMRHYGAPTRLLDWSYSPFAAVYFAVEHGTDDGAFWALNQTALAAALRASPKLAPIISILDDTRNSFNAETFKNTFARVPPEPFVCAINPYRLNERLSIQQGLFLCPGDVSRPFEENIVAVLGNKPDSTVITKLVISKKPSVRQDFLQKLHRMNMNAASLYPGLDGFSRSLATLLAFPKEMLPPDQELM